jgi:hypothetical protein
VLEQRKILNFPVGEDGLFEDTGKYDQVKEEHVRQTFFNVFQYTDSHCGNPRIYDPSGNYLCKDCNKFDKGYCLLVEGDISGEKGSCRHWENLDAGDAEINMAQKISKDFADYGETPNAGFGCRRCEYHTKAKETDSLGRDMFCKQGALRVSGIGCCALNNCDGMKTEFPDKAKSGNAYGVNAYGRVHDSRKNKNG